MAGTEATAWDEQSIADWIDSTNHTREARQLLRLAMRSVYGEEAAQISLLDLLAAIAGVGGDVDTLVGSAQSIRFAGGSQQLSIKLARKMARALGSVIRCCESNGAVRSAPRIKAFTAGGRSSRSPSRSLGGIPDPPLPPPRRRSSSASRWGR